MIFESLFKTKGTRKWNVWNVFATYRFEILEFTNLIITSKTELIKFAQCLMESYDELSSKGMLKEIVRLSRCLEAAKVTKEESFGWNP